MTAIFVSYTDGAGGEFLSASLQQHNNFFKGSYNRHQTGRIAFNDSLLSYFHFNDSNGIDINPTACYEYLTECFDSPMNYVFPIANTEKNSRILKYIKNKSNSKVISIYSDIPEYQKLINLEALRKIYLTNEAINLDYIKNIKNKLTLDSETAKLLFKKKLLMLDIKLLSQSEERNNENRLNFCKNYLNKVHPHPTDQTDFIISWEDLYYNLSNIEPSYVRLTKFLGIEYNDSILNSIKIRNQANKIDLDKCNYSSIIDNFYETHN